MDDPLTPHQARAIRDAISIGQTFADHLHSMRRMEAAMGSMGDAPSYEVARDAAVAEIQRRVDRRMAVL